MTLDWYILAAVAITGFLRCRWERRQQRIEDAAKMARGNYGRGR